MTEYRVSIHPHPITWTQRDDLAALWDCGMFILVTAASPAKACARAKAVLPWRLCNALTAEVVS